MAKFNFQTKSSVFGLGALAGVAIYSIYLWLGKDDDLNSWLASGESFGSTFGSIFFPVQYLIFCFGEDCPIPDYLATGLCVCLVALFYGYLSLSLKSFPKLALWACVISVIIFLFSIVEFGGSTNRIWSLLFWPAIRMNEFAVVSELPPGAYLLITYCLVVGLWYAALACGLWMLVRFPIRMRNPQSPEAGTTCQPLIIACPQCNKPLRIPTNAAKARCPACKAVFGTS